MDQFDVVLVNEMFVVLCERGVTGRAQVPIVESIVTPPLSPLEGSWHDVPAWVERDQMWAGRVASQEQLRAAVDNIAPGRATSGLLDASLLRGTFHFKNIDNNFILGT